MTDTRTENDAPALEPFCGTDPYRYYLTKPFNVGEHTYATNGHICIRVPKRVGVPDGDEHAPDPTALFLNSADHYRPFVVELPAATEEACEGCDGRGTEHDCPDCECECSNGHCHEGKVSSDSRVSVGINGVPFGAALVRLMLTLPGLQVNENHGEAGGHPMLRFRFNGGEGALMPLRKRLGIHVEAAWRDQNVLLVPYRDPAEAGLKVLRGYGVSVFGLAVAMPPGQQSARRRKSSRQGARRKVHRAGTASSKQQAA
jgi:hypothetical protein